MNNSNTSQINIAGRFYEAQVILNVHISINRSPLRGSKTIENAQFYQKVVPYDNVRAGNTRLRKSLSR